LGKELPVKSELLFLPQFPEQSGTLMDEFRHLEAEH
jgi:hypothetical protein